MWLEMCLTAEFRTLKSDTGIIANMWCYIYWTLALMGYDLHRPVFLKKLIVIQLMKKFLTLYGTWGFITVFSRSHHLSLLTHMNPVHILTPYFFNTWVAYLLLLVRITYMCVIVVQWFWLSELFGSVIAFPLTTLALRLRIEIIYIFCGTCWNTYVAVEDVMICSICRLLTIHYGWVVNTLASYLGGPGFSSQPRDRLS
jgi:hypothetical protein